jgi:hypothetical protein
MSKTPTEASRRDILTAAPAAAAAALAGAAVANAVSIGMAKADDIDPIFAAIERHRQAWTEFDNRCCELDEVGTPEARTEYDRLCELRDAAENELSDADCSTMAGVIALLSYVNALDAEHYLWQDNLIGEDDPDDAKPRPWAYFFHLSLAETLAEISGRGA